MENSDKDIYEEMYLHIRGIKHINHTLVTHIYNVSNSSNETNNGKDIQQGTKKSTLICLVMARRAFPKTD